MPKLKKDDRNNKIEQARQMYVKGYDHQSIADVLDVAVSTITKWAADNDFETSRKRSLISRAEMRRDVLESYADLRDGKTPKVKPDDLAKYAAAYEKLSETKPIIGTIDEVCSLIDDEYIREMKTARTRDEKTKILDELRRLRIIMCRVTDRVIKEYFDNA